MFKGDDRYERRQFIVFGFYPLMVSFFGILQTIWLRAPLFCFGCAITLMYVYMMSLDDLVSIDPLTNLNNRNQLNKYVSTELNRSADRQLVYYVMMLDLDKFKVINDRFGHSEGDLAIQNAAKAIMEPCKNNPLHPFVARYGGDEFIIIVKTDSEENIIDLESKIFQSFNNINGIIQKPYVLDTSIGYARAEGDISDFETVKNKADEALYRNKKEKYSING